MYNNIVEICMFSRYYFIYGLVLIAENAFEMSKILQIDSKALREAAFTRGNRLYHGYRFRLGISSEPWPV